MTDDQKGGISPVAAAAAVTGGVILGAGVAAVGMAMNSDEGKQKIEEAKGMVSDKVEEIKDKAANTVNIAKDSISSAVEDIKKEVIK